jgi:hypothetical protein
MFRNTYDVISFIDMIVLLFSSIEPRKSTLYIMPPFEPNSAMLNKHSDKGQSNWEIYAWCIRDAMAKAGGFSKCEVANKEKLIFEKFMKGDLERIEVDNKVYHAFSTANKFSESNQLTEGLLN